MWKTIEDSRQLIDDIQSHLLEIFKQGWKPVSPHPGKQPIAVPSAFGCSSVRVNGSTLQTDLVC